MRSRPSSDDGIYASGRVCFEGQFFRDVIGRQKVNIGHQITQDKQLILLGSKHLLNQRERWKIGK